MYSSSPSARQAARWPLSARRATSSAVSAGLRIFLGLLQNVEEKGGHVYLKGLNDDVRAIFALTGFCNFFEII